MPVACQCRALRAAHPSAACPHPCPPSSFPAHVALAPCLMPAAEASAATVACTLPALVVGRPPLRPICCGIQDGCGRQHGAWASSARSPVRAARRWHLRLARVPCVRPAFMAALALAAVSLRPQHHRSAPPLEAAARVHQLQGQALMRRPVRRRSFHLYYSNGSPRKTCSSRRLPSCPRCSPYWHRASRPLSRRNQ